MKQINLDPERYRSDRPKGLPVTAFKIGGTVSALWAVPFIYYAPDITARLASWWAIPGVYAVAFAPAFILLIVAAIAFGPND